MDSADTFEYRRDDSADLKELSVDDWLKLIRDYNMYIDAEGKVELSKLRQAEWRSVEDWDINKSARYWCGNI